MVNELGRIIAAVVLLLARAIGRVWQALRFLIRRARQTRSATSAAVPKGGRLLDIAALSLAADLFVLLEWWRRDLPSVSTAALIGFGAGTLAAVAVTVLLRGPIVQYALAGVEVLRLASVFAFAFAAPTVVNGGTSDPALGAVAIGCVIAFAVLERGLWGIAATGRVGDGVRYVGFLLPLMLLLGLIALILNGLVALSLAEVALLIAMGLTFAIKAPPARPLKEPKPPKPPKNQPPAQREAPDPDSPEGSYHLYRPNSLKPPES